MVLTKSTSVDEYIAAQPPPVRRVLTNVRRTMRKALPDAQEVISYSIPAYRQHGRIVIYFAAWTSHYSIYPSSRRLEKTFQKELANYVVSGKGTIQFPLDEPVPEALIEKLVKFRANEAAEAAKTRAATKKAAAARKKPSIVRPGAANATTKAAAGRASATRKSAAPRRKA